MTTCSRSMSKIWRQWGVQFTFRFFKVSIWVKNICKYHNKRSQKIRSTRNYIRNRRNFRVPRENSPFSSIYQHLLLAPLEWFFAFLWAFWESILNRIWSCRWWWVPRIYRLTFWTVISQQLSSIAEHFTAMLFNFILVGRTRRWWTCADGNFISTAVNDWT